MDFDLVIANGAVIDGTGRPRFRADVGILGGRVAAITAGERLQGRQTIDATGLVVAPGFVDVHSHSDWLLPLSDHDKLVAPLVLQGITTLVTGHCGFSPAPVTDEAIPVMQSLADETFSYRWRSMAEFLDTLRRDGILLNAAFLVGHGTMRYTAMGTRFAEPAPTTQEMETLASLTRGALREGAFGLSAGLQYAPGIFAADGELLPLIQIAAAEGGIYTVHSRAYTWISAVYDPASEVPHNVLAAREQIDLARQAGAKLQLSHLIFVGSRTWPNYRAVLDDVERAADEGLDVAFDAFPYTMGNSTISVVFPAWFLEDFTRNINDPQAIERLKGEIAFMQEFIGMGYRNLVLMYAGTPALAGLEGLDFATIAQRLDMPEFEAYTHVARASGGEARILLGTYSGDGDYEEPLRAVLAHPLCAFMTDTLIFRRGCHNPATFGAFPRILGRYCRDLGLFSLEEAVHRMTSFSAGRIGLRDVGRIAENQWADLVLFDPATIADNTTSDRFDAPPSGIRAVLISGQVVARDGQIVTAARPGRVISRS